MGGLHGSHEYPVSAVNCLKLHWSREMPALPLGQVQVAVVTEAPAAHN